MDYFRRFPDTKADKGFANAPNNSRPQPAISKGQEVSTIKPKI